MILCIPSSSYDTRHIDTGYMAGLTLSCPGNTTPCSALITLITLTQFSKLSEAKTVQFKAKIDVNGCSVCDIYNEEVGCFTSKIDKPFIVMSMSTFQRLIASIFCPSHTFHPS